MHSSHYVWASLLSLGLISPGFANDSVEGDKSSISSIPATSSTQQSQSQQLPHLKAALQELKNILREFKMIILIFFLH